MGLSAGAITNLQMAGGTMSMFGAMSSANAQKAQLNAQAQVAQTNAALANQQARFALEIGEQQEGAQRLKAAQTFSDQRAALAANGVDLGSGSPSEILATTKFMGERDALTIRDNAIRQAWGYKVNESNSLAQASADRAMARAINPTLVGATSLLTSAGNVASTWYKLNSVGVK